MGVGAPPLCKVAMIGAGSMAREHLRAFADVEGVTLAGIESRTRERAEQLAGSHHIPAVCDSVDALYERTRADLVVVTVPELQMRAVAEQCVAFPWTVLLEKPAGYDLADAEAILGAARTAGRHVYVALNRRCYSSTNAVLHDLKRSERRFIRVQDQQDQASALASGQPARVVRNWMYANSIHTIDFLRVFGRGRVTGVRPIRRWKPEDPDVVISEIVFESGDTGIYEGIWNGPGPWAVTVATPSRRWEMRPLEQATYQNRGERTLHAAEIHPWDTFFKAGFRRQAELAVEAATTHQNPGLATLEDATETMRVIHQIFS